MLADAMVEREVFLFDLALGLMLLGKLMVVSTGSIGTRVTAAIWSASR